MGNEKLEITMHMMLLELELNRGGDKEDIDIIKFHLPNLIKYSENGEGAK